VSSSRLALAKTGRTRTSTSSPYDSIEFNAVGLQLYLLDVQSAQGTSLGLKVTRYVTASCEAPPITRLGRKGLRHSLGLVKRHTNAAPFDHSRKASCADRRLR
jgi:hypothetical protein